MRAGNPGVDDVLRKRRMNLDVAITFAVEDIMVYEVSALVDGVQEAVNDATTWVVADALEAASASDSRHSALHDFLREINSN